MTDPDVPSAADLLRWAETLSGIARTGLGVHAEPVRARALRGGAARSRPTSAPPRSKRPRPTRSSRSGSAPSARASPATSRRRSRSRRSSATSDGEILLTQRADSGVWLYPVGWADVGYSPSEIAIKEVFEETGIEVEPVSLIAVFDGLRLGFARLPLYSIVFHCRMIGGELRGHPLETRAVGFFATRRAAMARSPAAHRWVDTAFAAIDGDSASPAASTAPRPRPGAATPTT